MTEKQQAKSLWHYYKNFSFTDKLIFGALVLTLALMTNLFYFEVHEEIKRTANPEERLAIIVMAALMSFIVLYLINLISQIVIWIIRKFARIQLKGIPKREEVKTGQTLLKKIGIKNALIGLIFVVAAYSIYPRLFADNDAEIALIEQAKSACVNWISSKYSSVRFDARGEFIRTQGDELLFVVWGKERTSERDYNGLRCVYNLSNRSMTKPHAFNPKYY